MRRSNTRRILRPIALDPSGGVPPGNDDLSTWSSSAAISTMALPGTIQDIYPLLVDVTNVIPSAARSDVGALRFRHQNGVTIGHVRTATNRILIGGNFHGGINTIHVFWGKTGATQPGVGFPSSADVMAPYRLALIFENGAPVDLSPNPAPWTIVGTPTFTAEGPIGDAMTCAEGSYIETTAAKLRGDARSSRAALVVFSVKERGDQARLLCWANWLNNQRAWQLWIGAELELYASSNGTSFQRWRQPSPAEAGWNCIAANWQANVAENLTLLNGEATTTGPGFDGGPIGQLFNSTDPYIVGGTKVPGFYHDDKINSAFELYGFFNSANHALIFRQAWANNAVFWGAADRTPDNFDVPDLTNVPLNTEVSFAAKQITSISPETPISVSGGGNPTYSIGSAFSTPTDIKAKGSTPGFIGPGNWLFSHHTSATTNSTVRESSITIGTISSLRRSTTLAAASGGSGVPTGPADVVVNSVSALRTAFANATPGQVIELAAGDYRSQGKLDLSNKDFRNAATVWLRASTRAYRGPLPSEGGLMVSGETFFTTGSGGAELAGLNLRNIHNVGFDGFRIYAGRYDNLKYYSSDVISCTNLTFQHMKWCGWRPDASFANGAYVNEITWTPVYKDPDPWKQQGRGMQLGVGGRCDRITFKKCMFHYFGDIQLYLASVSNSLLEDCVFTDAMSDHVRNDGGQDNFIARRCVFYRTWKIQGSPGGGVAHSDHVQNTTKTQNGWRNHRFEMCIFSPGDCLDPHIQGSFYECDNYPQYPMGDGLYVTDCLFESRVVNTIYARPSNRTIVTRTAILQQQFGGRDSRRDLTFHSPQIVFNEHNNLSQENNKADRCIYFSISKKNGDQVVDSSLLQAGSYGSQLHDYPQYSSSSWRQVKVLNPYTGVLDINEMSRWSPKTSSALHPNNKGYHYGASALLQHYGALIT